MSERTLIKGGIVLTQDESLGEMAGADILVEDDRIVAVGHGLSADGAKVIDATGDIVIPGFVDTHRHTWETSIRTCAPDYALITYFSAILDQFAPKYRPDDVLAANRWGALECINAGITTLVDWSHIMNTPDHADALANLAKEGLLAQQFAIIGFAFDQMDTNSFRERLTNDIVLLARFDVGQPGLRIGNVDLKRLIERTVDAFCPDADLKRS